MNKFLHLLAALVMAASASVASAKTIHIPETKPVVTLDIPNAWEPEFTDHGVGAESPDEVVTIFFEVAKSEKQMNKLIDDSFSWLTEEHNLKINPNTKVESNVTVGGTQANKIEFNAQSKKYGPAKVGFIFAPVGERVLVITYWATASEFTAKHQAVLNQIYDSVRPR
ncbi:hypothetical protein [Hydrogenophaga soli]